MFPELGDGVADDVGITGCGDFAVVRGEVGNFAGKGILGKEDHIK